MTNLISRSAAIQALKKAKELASEPPTHFDIYINKTFDLCIRLIAAFDAIDAVSVVHAKWEKSEPGYFICSHCNADVAIFNGYRNFCPNCGAKMDAKEER